MSSSETWTEADRLAALHRTGLLDTPPEKTFDDLVRLAAELLGTPMAGLHLVAETRQFGKAELGLGVRDIPRDIAFCPQTLHEPDGLVIPDATKDARFADNPLVTGQPGIRFYAGVPLLHDGLPIGALCVIDTHPRSEGLTEREMFVLTTLAAQASREIALRQALAQRDALLATQQQSDALRQQTLDSATDYAILSTDSAGRITGWNAGAENLFGWTADEMLSQSAERIFLPDDLHHDLLGTEMDRAMGLGRSDSARWYHRKDGSRFWASGQIRPLRDNIGGTIGFVQVVQDRTEQRRTARRLERSEERYRALFDAIDAGFCIFDLKFDEANRPVDYRFVEVNPAFARQTGLVDAAGRWMRDLAPAHEQHWFEIYGRVAQTGEAVRFEHRAEALNRWYDVQAFRVGDPAQHRVAALFNDISDRRQFELTLQQSEARWRGLFEQLQEGFILGELIRDAAGHVTDWRYLEVNPAWAALFGTPADRAVGRTIRDMFPGIEAEWITQMAEVVATRRAATFVRQVGTLHRWFEGRVHPMDADRFAILFQDITSRRKTEAQQFALLELGDRLRETDDPEEMSFVAAEIIGRTLEADRSGYGMVRNRQAYIAQDWTAPGIAGIAGHHDFAEYGEFFADLARGETLVIGDTRADPRTAAKTARLEAISIRSLLNLPVIEQGTLVALLFVHSAKPRPWTADEIGFTHSVADRTQAAIARRRAEAELRDLNSSLETMVQARTAELARTQAALVQSQKMEAVGQLTGGLAHDFNNLLTGITGSLELLQTRVTQGRLDGLSRYVTAAQGGARRAAALTHRLLAFSRRQTLDPKPVDVNRLVTDMEDLVRRTVGPEIGVRVEAAPLLWATLADPPQLENALLNLCINARDAMPNGGVLVIRTGNKHIAPQDAAEWELRDGDYVLLSVCDNGAGMTPEIIARAFDPFFTTKPIGQGTGLGLSMIYGFARQSGGQVQIESQPGHGTTVSILLPRFHGEAQSPTAQPALTEAPRARRNDTVMVVDDDPTVRMLVAEVLQELGYNTLEAADGATGLHLLQTAASPIDLLITDVGLPGGMNGRQVADAARSLQPALKILFITGYAENAVVGNGQLDPGMHVLTKPFMLENLAKRIKTIIEED